MSDEKRIQALITELYALVSGPGEQPRDWAREAELNAKLKRAKLEKQLQETAL